MNKKNKKHIKFEESEESEVEINKNESFFNENTIDQEDLTLNFDRAVKKDLYKGKKGRMLFELQQKSKGDIRFSFGKNFKNDVDIDKVSKSTKYTTDAFDEVQDTTAKKKDESEKINIDTDTIQKEKNNNLALISSLISNEDFFGYKVNRKIMKHHDLITKRFDPLLGVGSNFIKKDETQINDKEPEMKISKGFEKISAIKPKFDSNEHLRKKDKDADLSKVINSIQTTELKEVKVEINYNFFKNLTSGEEKVDSKKEIVKEEKSGIVKTIKKLSLEERHAKKEEYKRLKKEKLKKKIEKEKKEQLQDEKYRLKLLKEYGEEKTENYLRMIKLISEKKQNKSKKIKEEE